MTVTWRHPQSVPTPLDKSSSGTPAGVTNEGQEP